MADDRMQRRLAAILVADVVGYSRLMEKNEEGTLARLKTLRREVVDPAIDSHRGRLVKLTGDGALVEFASAVDAVRSAVAIQQSIAAREQNEPPDHRISFRIGVNLGDILVEGDDVYGDGVNISARLEGLADPGGVVISGNVYDEVARRLPVGFEDMGELRVKNIDRPIRAWRVLPEGAAASPGQASAALPVAGKDPPALPLPDKPSIAVLPFTNMSGDPEQDYFADGLSEDIITELSRFRWLFVIARNSCFVYKGRAVDVRTVGRELGVRYVLEGGVRKSGERLRITAQLIEAATGNHLWAEKYDGKLADVFDLQDNITRTIVATLPGRIEAAYAERIVRTPPKDMAAYELLLAAKVLHHRATKDDNTAAFALVERAIGIDPGFAQAYAWKACLTGQAVARGFFDGNSREHLKRAFDLVMKGLALDENDIECHRVLCESFMDQGDLARARMHHDRAFALNPNDPRIVAQRGELMTWFGEPDQAVEWLQTATHLDPFGVRERAHLLGRALLAARRYAEAADAYRQSAGRHRPEYHADLAAALAQAGRAEEAAAEVAETLRIKPEFSVASYVEGLHYSRDVDREHHREALIKAGLPAQVGGAVRHG
jgi:adenylate cyclase